MMDFSTEDWGVTDAADHLTSSLFSHIKPVGTPKSKKAALQKETGKELNDKKGKVSKSVDSQQSIKTKKKRLSVSEGKKNSCVRNDYPEEGNSEAQEKKGKKVSKVVQDKKAKNSITPKDIKGNKRKAETIEEQSPSKKPKHVQQADTVTDTNTGGEKKKRRRKKKKNSNKRNKYKHLSVKKSEGNEDVDGDKNSKDNRLTDDKPTVQEKVNIKDGLVERTNAAVTSEPNTGVLLASKKAKQKEKKMNKLLKKKGEKQIKDNNSNVHSGGICKQENKQPKFNLKVLDKMLSDTSPVSAKGHSQKGGETTLTKKVEINSLTKGETTPSKEEETTQTKERGTTLSLKERMMDKLKSARFRFLNEQLYNQEGSESFSMFKEDKEAFQVYHQGFQSQVSKWPVNPVNTIIGQLQARPPNLVIADFGCGDAAIARKLPNKVHSFDLVAINKYVTACDMAKVPLKKETVDVAVFCLSLMGRNLPDYLKEASRVLKPGGSLKVAEVTSRIRNLVHFKKTMEKFGFRLVNEDTTNKMFCLFDFKKSKPSKNIPSEFHLEPCIYKRR
ncbi:uncharacterized protein [Argopecten irradians]|uniref:uncharacterized protein n=1 Tax=Argopecten irradians TaxID=31199 RepID=UPI003712EB9A